MEQCDFCEEGISYDTTTCNGEAICLDCIEYDNMVKCDGDNARCNIWIDPEKDTEYTDYEWVWYDIDKKKKIYYDYRP